MNISPTLTLEEFKKVHNGLCDLRHACDRLENVLHPEMYQLLIKAKNLIRDGLNGVYEQEEREYNRKNSHYESVKKELGLSTAWSMLEVDNLYGPHTFSDADRVVYRHHWGPKPVQASIKGNTWAALWRAADECIKTSDDNHHIFIENFTVEDDDYRTLILSTGS
jgi:hypothetical protein